MSVPIKQEVIEAARAIDPRAATLLEHYKHKVEVAIYTDGISDPANVSLECLDCYVVLDTYDITPDSYVGGTDGG